MTKPTTPMATTISSQDISLTPHYVRWTTGSDATKRGGTSAPAHGTSSGLTIGPARLGTADGRAWYLRCAPGTADQPALRRAGRGRAAMVETSPRPNPPSEQEHTMSPDRKST